MNAIVIQPTRQPARQMPTNRTTTFLEWNTARFLVAALENEGERNVALMVATQMYFGLRIGDVLSLTWGDIRQTVMTIGEGKTGKARTITLHPDYVAMRDRYLGTFYASCQPADHEPVFVGTRGPRTGQAITVTAANNRFASALKRHSIETANASTHTLRKTFGRRVWESTGKTEAGLVLLSQILNHSSTAVTRLYLGITGEEIAAAYLSL
jgi:integrase